MKKTVIAIGICIIGVLGYSFLISPTVVTQFGETVDAVIAFLIGFILAFLAVQYWTRA